jgi:hypothetical protein
MTDQCRNVIADANDPPELFRRMGRLTRIARDDDGRPYASGYAHWGLMDWLAGKASWKRPNKNEVLVDCYPPAAPVRAVLEQADGTDAPVLEQVVSMPFFAADGTLVNEPGYSAAGRVWHEPVPGLLIPPVPKHPSDMDLARAKRLLLKDMLGDFPFETAADQAHALSLTLQPFVRPMIAGPTPLYLSDAPSPGTGKGLMVKAALFCSQGSLAAFTPLPAEEAEMRKELTSCFRAGYPVIVFDNVTGIIRSGVLSQAIAEPVWRQRLLGVNEDVTARIRNTWVMTGNNIQLCKDLNRRHVRIRLNASTATKAKWAERPWLREGFQHPDLLGWVRDNHAELAWACLTIIQAWVAAGRPAWKPERPPAVDGQEQPAMPKPIGGFEEWCSVMGGIVGHAGVPGFLWYLTDAYDETGEDDQTLHTFVQEWWDKYQDSPRMTGELTLLSSAGEALGVSGLFGRSSDTAAGIALRALRGNVINGYRVEKNKSRKWVLQRHRQPGEEIQWPAAM